MKYLEACFNWDGLGMTVSKLRDAMNGKSCGDRWSLAAGWDERTSGESGFV